jgi:membrane-anchored mycosin MYCP
LRRYGQPVLAACVAGLFLAAPGPVLPGPLPGCPPQHGIAAPAGPPWAQRMLRFSSAWDRTRGGGVTVAVVDSGVDANPQFGHRVATGPDLAQAGPGMAAGADCVGHGTSMASIIAAAPVPGVSFTGVAPAARILSIKISDTDTFRTAVTPLAIRDAVALGVGVINLSLATVDDVPALRAAVEFAQSRNVVVVAAAGNDSQAGGKGPFYPAAYPGVLSVGAVGPGGALAGFSDRRTPVSVTAPGVDITSAYPGTFPDSYDPAQSGTSFAAAFVSGVVALVRSAYPRLDEAQVVARIEATADGGSGPGAGYGLVNPVRAVTAALPAAALPAATLPSAAPAEGAAATQPAAGDPDAGRVAWAVGVGSFGLLIVLVTAVLAVPAPGRHRARVL